MSTYMRCGPRFQPPSSREGAEAETRSMCLAKRGAKASAQRSTQAVGIALRSTTNLHAAGEGVIRGGRGVRVCFLFVNRLPVLVCVCWALVVWGVVVVGSWGRGGP